MTTENRWPLRRASGIPVVMRELIFFVERLETPTGAMWLVTDDERRVRALDWEDHQDRMGKLLRRHYGDAVRRQPAAGRSAAARAVADYFDGDLTALVALPTATEGTEFQRVVWRALREIPAGETRSYGALARAIGRPAASRAVGMANGANPIAVIVPCHRVIGADASLIGFGGGLDRKRWLLAHEAPQQRLDARSVAVPVSSPVT
jgi:methylated-DNA-[protein]-cysteine S-methyltransferase